MGYLKWAENDCLALCLIMLVMIVTNNEWMKKSSSHFLIIDFDEPKAPLSDDNDKLQVSQACHFHD